MSRPIGERMRSWRWWGEQVAHCAVGFVIAAAVTYGAMSAGLALAGAATLGLLSSVLAGVAREGKQNWGDAPAVGAAEDMLVDLAAWVVGACFAPLLAL